MKNTGQQPSTPEAVVDFLGRIMPFKDLEQQVLRDVARHVRVGFFPKGTWLLIMGESEVQYLYLIQQGGVKSFLTDEEGQTTLKDYRGEGEYIGALGIIRGTVANMNVETVEDTFCFLLPRKVFLDLITSQSGFAQYYLKSFSEKVVTTAYTELRKHRVARRSDEDLFLFSNKVVDIIGRSLRRVNVGCSVQQAATIMMQYNVGSLLVYEGDAENIVGIMTDKDLRNKVVAAGMEGAVPVSRVMTAPVISIPSQAVCFDALIMMMSHGIHHLAVEQNGKCLGVITSHDIMLLQGNSPYMLFKEIGSQSSYPALYSLAQKIPAVIRNLINEGAKAGNIARMITLLNDRVLTQLLKLTEEELGQPPVPYCWLLLGSEGRREQTFKTDQDNALLYADPADAATQQAAAAYFSELGKRVVDHLVNCGYPPCRQGVMASEQQWCQPLVVWKERFISWLDGSSPAELLRGANVFDFRPVHGYMPLAEELREVVATTAKRQRGYLRPLINDCLARRAPLSIFRDVIVAEDGRQETLFDIKRQGLDPYIRFARILALYYGIRETNTLARLVVLGREKLLEWELLEKVQEACEIQMQLQLIHQLHQVEGGILPDTMLSPGELSELEKKMLKDGFELVAAMNGLLEQLGATDGGAEKQ